MATVNIGAENADDPYYRYKMPKPVSKIEGRGNGIKTNVVNNVDIARALSRPPEHILKFLGVELGAQTKYDAKTGTSIVNGAFDDKTLMTHIESFVKQFVQCHSCRNPETDVSVKKGSVILRCKACGNSSPVDMSHKLTNYILKNPPVCELSKEEKKLRKLEEERTKSVKAKKDKKDKEKDKEKERALKKKGSKASTSASEEATEKENDTQLSRAEGSQGSKIIDSTVEEGEAVPEQSTKVKSNDDDDVVWHADVSAEAIAKRRQEQLTSTAVASMVTQGNIQAEASEAKKKLKKILTKLEFSEESVAAVNELGAKFFKEEVDDKEIASYVRSASDDTGIQMTILFTVLLWDAPEKLAKIVKEKAGLLKMLAPTRKCQLALMFGLEYVLAMMISERMKEAPQVLSVLYDLDIVEEEVIDPWYERPEAGRKALGISVEAGQELRKHCQKFMDWLQAEEDDDDDDEEEEEDE